MGEWKDIESAPKDKKIVLYYPSCGFSGPEIVFGSWLDDRYAKKPRPYWTNDLERYWGVVRCRKYPPTMWMDLEPPKDE